MHSISLLSLLLAARAAAVPVGPDDVGLPPGCEDMYEVIALTEFNDGPTPAGDAGIGAEFETLNIQFYDDKCSLENTFKAKRKTIKGQDGKNFVLSADTSVEMGKGKLSAEYVLDGRAIKVGDGSAAAAGKAAREKLNAWTPWDDKPKPNEVTIENYPECKGPWVVKGLTKDSKKDTFVWAPQVTAPMPLEAMYALMTENVKKVTKADGRNILNGETESTTRGQNLYLVNKEYFQSLGLKMDIEKVNDAVFGFCTLVLGYAKAANKKVDENDPNVIERSPKSWLPFMPRTEFYTIFNSVKSVFPPSGELYEIFNVLACYKTTYDQQSKKLVTSIDKEYCPDGDDVAKPVTGDKFGKLQYKYIGKYGDPKAPKKISIREWIEDIDSSKPDKNKKDLLTAFDENYDGSIGGLKTAQEKMHPKSSRSVPLFEFRDLDPIFTTAFESFMKEVDESVVKLHKDFAQAPKMRVKRKDVEKCEIPKFSSEKSSSSSSTKSSSGGSSTPTSTPSASKSSGSGSVTPTPTPTPSATSSKKSSSAKTTSSRRR